MTGIEVPWDDAPVAVSEPPSPRRTSPDPEPPTTLYWVHDVECAFTALLWNHPDFIERARTELDLEAHISVPGYRAIIKALIIVYGDIGVDLDFACVLHCIRELRAYEEVGGIEGLNQAYTGGGFCHGGFKNPEVFFREYLGLIKTYAVVRGTDPYQTVRRFTGHGLLCKNKLAIRPQDPTVIGLLRCPCCGHNLQLRGWLNGPELKLKTEPDR